MKDFTQKPDSACDNGFMIFNGKRNVPIAKVYRGGLLHSDKDQARRAKLIAAAPDLLAALLAIVNEGNAEARDSELTVAGYNMACAAIEKATN